MPQELQEVLQMPILKEGMLLKTTLKTNTYLFNRTFTCFYCKMSQISFLCQIYSLI